MHSILGQTVPVDEIVVCDDGSTDGTLAIIERLTAETRIDVRIIRNATNLGPARNFQQAINLCRGDIIFLSDQDDVWHPNKVATITRYFDLHPSISTVFTNAELIDQDGKTLPNTLWDCCFDKRLLTWFKRGLALECFSWANHATGATMALRAMKMPDLQYHDDFLHDHALALMALNTDSLGYVDQCLINYRLHDNQACGIRDDEQPTWADFMYVMPEAWQLCTAPDKQVRLQFLSLRHKTKYNAAGVLLVLLRTAQYRKLYQRGACMMMRMDAVCSLRHTARRIANKAHSLLHKHPTACA